MGRDHKNSQSFNLCQVLGLELMSPDPLKCLGCSLIPPSFSFTVPSKTAYIVKLTIYTVEVDAEKRGLTNIKFQKFEKGKAVGPKQ